MDVTKGCRGKKAFRDVVTEYTIGIAAIAFDARNSFQFLQDAIECMVYVPHTLQEAAGHNKLGL